MNADAITLAAQADLVLLTAEMLRPPPIAPDEDSWFELSSNELDPLLQTAFGTAAEKVFDELSGLTPHSALAEVRRCAR